LRRSRHSPATSRPGRPTTYTLVRDNGVHRPHIGRHGQPSTVGLKREQTWRSICILTSFSVRDLIATASTEEVTVSYNYAQRYCAHLAGAGILIPIATRPTRYRLTPSSRTGPIAPRVVTLVQVIDGNTGAVMAHGKKEAE